MSSFAILLRGVNVGGRNRVPMADLRTALTSAGLTQVRTYIQSGNIVASSPADDAEAVAAQVRAVIARTFHVDVPAIALSATDLEAVVDANPYPAEPDPRRLHAIVLPHPPTEQMLRGVEARLATAVAAGSPDSVTVVGRTAYLHTPAGFGTSRLASALLSGGSSPLADGTARNWATVTAVLAMLAEP